MRLIDVDELIVMEYGGIKFVPKEFIDDAPTVDAVEVVRCRDCKHNPNDTWFECPISNLPYKEDRWCWKGERQ